MKKLIIINLILISIIYIIPPIKIENIEMILEETITIEKNTNEEKLSSRSLEEPRIEKEKNLILTTDCDLRILSNLTAEDYNKMLEHTALNGLGNALVQAEKESGINGLYLLGLACVESAYGTSNFAKNRNNLVGWNAVDSNPGKATYFKSKGECIVFVAERLKTNYLTDTGRYFEGYTARSIDIHYCTDKLHADKIINVVNKLKNKI